MIDEHQEERAALDALDLLEGEEKARFDAEVARNPELRRHVEELRAAATALAHTAPQIDPPAGLKERILAAAPTRYVPAAPAHSQPSNKLLSFPILIAWAAAACFALSTAWTARLYVMARTQSAVLMDQQKLADAELQALRNRYEAERLLTTRELALARDRAAHSQDQVAQLEQKLKNESDLAQMRIAALVSLAGNSPQALAVAVWDPENQRGVLSVGKLPAAGPGKDYQLWVIPASTQAVPKPHPISAGVFKVDPGTNSARTLFRADEPVASVATFAVSVEPTGGSRAPSSDIVLLGQ
jgi:anti-sigma-K factor RskA